MAFFGYLTTRNKTIEVGAQVTVYALKDAMEEFIQAHHLPKANEGWEKQIVRIPNTEYNAKEKTSEQY
jgi:hypothetical protein